MRRVRLSLAVAAGSITIGGVLFSFAQHVSIATGLYWAVVTAATVGYGDIVPHNTASRLVAVMVILIAIPALGYAYNRIIGLHVRRQLAPIHRIAADLHERITGERHPDAPA